MCCSKMVNTSHLVKFAYVMQMSYLLKNCSKNVGPTKMKTEHLEFFKLAH